MYYTIEGKRFLRILYVAGLLLGSVFINLSIQMNLFRTTDFLGFVEYIQSLKGLDTSAFFSYVCLVRFRQLLIFFVCLFIFSPYVVFCVLDFLVSVLMGFFISTLVLYYGWPGMIKGIGFLIPHYIFYGILLCRGLSESGNTENILSLMHDFMYNGRTIPVYRCFCSEKIPVS